MSASSTAHIARDFAEVRAVLQRIFNKEGDVRVLVLPLQPRGGCGHIVVRSGEPENLTDGIVGTLLGVSTTGELSLEALFDRPPEVVAAAL